MTTVDTQKKYPVMYLLHGFSNNRNSWIMYTNAVRYAEERKIAVVTVSAENKSYSKVGGEDFKTFIGKELPEFITSNFPISDKKEDTYIAGLSMGGYGSILHALSAPERFCAFGSFSAAIDWYPEEVAGLKVEGPVPDEYNLFKLADKLAEEKKAFPKIYMSCGCKDGLYDINTKYRDHLKELGADVTWQENPQYAHEWPFWDLEVKSFLDWIPRTDYYSTLPNTGV